MAPQLARALRCAEEDAACTALHRFEHCTAIIGTLVVAYATPAAALSGTGARSKATDACQTDSKGGFQILSGRAVIVRPPPGGGRPQTTVHWSAAHTVVRLGELRAEQRLAGSSTADRKSPGGYCHRSSPILRGNIPGQFDGR